MLQYLEEERRKQCRTVILNLAHPKRHEWKPQCDNLSNWNMDEYLSAEIISGAKPKNLQHHSN